MINDDPIESIPHGFQHLPPIMGVRGLLSYVQRHGEAVAVQVRPGFLPRAARAVKLPWRDLTQRCDFLFTVLDWVVLIFLRIQCFVGPRGSEP